MAYDDATDTVTDTEPGTAGTYTFAPDRIDTAAARAAISAFGTEDIIDAVYDEATDTYTAATDTGWRNTEPAAVYTFAAATDDEQDIHVGDVPVDNIANGALTASWMLDTLEDDGRSINGVEEIAFTAPVRYDDEIRMLRLIDEEADGREDTYRLDVRCENDDGTVTTEPAVTMTVTPGERLDGAVTPQDHSVYMSTMIGSFFDRTGDVMVAVNDLDVFTPFDELDADTDYVMDRRLVTEHDHPAGVLRTYNNDFRPADSGSIKAKMQTTVLETASEDDLYNIL